MKKNDKLAMNSTKDKVRVLEVIFLKISLPYYLNANINKGICLLEECTVFFLILRSDGPDGYFMTIFTYNTYPTVDCLILTDCGFIAISDLPSSFSTSMAIINNFN